MQSQNIAINCELPTPTFLRDAGNRACEYFEKSGGVNVQAELPASRISK
jgi:hypothetical protein